MPRVSLSFQDRTELVAFARGLHEPGWTLIASDPISAFGGVIASNSPFDGETAEALGDPFVECITAPSFTDSTQAILATRR